MAHVAGHGGIGDVEDQVREEAEHDDQHDIGAQAI